MNDRNYKQRHFAARQFIESLELLERQLTHHQHDESNSGDCSVTRSNLSPRLKPDNCQPGTVTLSQSGADENLDSMRALEAAAADIEQFIQTQELE